MYDSWANNASQIFLTRLNRISLCLLCQVAIALFVPGRWEWNQQQSDEIHKNPFVCEYCELVLKGTQICSGSVCPVASVFVNCCTCIFALVGKTPRTRCTRTGFN